MSAATNKMPLRLKYVFIALLCGIIALGVFTFQSQKQTRVSDHTQPASKDEKIITGEFDQKYLSKSDEYWKSHLTQEQYYILREAGTEAPFSGVLNHENRSGTYFSIGCDQPLFRSEQKYDSKTGWPSFWAPVHDGAVVLRRESGLGDNRIEVLDTCGNHLGHVFDDGPAPTGKRYCMNSIALRFVPDEN